MPETRYREVTTAHPAGWTLLRVLLVLGLLAAIGIAAIEYFGYRIEPLGLVSMHTAVFALSVAVAVVAITLLFALASLHVRRREEVSEELLEDQDPDEDRRSFTTLDTDIAPMGRPVTAVPGLGAHAAERLASIEVETLTDLVNADTDRVAHVTETDVQIARQWQRLAELMLVPGIGPRTAELLIAANVRSVDELAHERPESLLERIREVGRDRSVTFHEVDAGPGRVEHWVHAARRHLMTAR